MKLLQWLLRAENDAADYVVIQGNIMPPRHEQFITVKYKALSVLTIISFDVHSNCIYKMR